MTSPTLKPPVHMVYFKRRGSGIEDCLPCLVGTENLHVIASLITRTVPLHYDRPALPADEVRRIAEKWATEFEKSLSGALHTSVMGRLSGAIESAINEALGNVAAGREGV